MVGRKHKLCRNFMVACKASGAREHGHDSKHEALSGRTKNARKGERLGGSTRGAHGQKSCKGEMIVLEES
jgi:hypothetical protein